MWWRLADLARDWVEVVGLQRYSKWFTHCGIKGGGNQELAIHQHFTIGFTALLDSRKSMVCIFDIVLILI